MYLYLVIIICLILAVFTVWKEYKSGRHRLAWRIAASLLAVASLACLALPLSYHGDRELANNEAVLLTNGFSADSLNSLKNDSLLTIDPAITAQYKKAKLITLDQLKSMTPVVSRLHIFGNGLNPDELRQLDSIPVVFHSAPSPSGISSINWTDRLKQGQPLKVQGVYNNTSGNLVRLLLKGLNTTVDSLVIAPQSTAQFSFTDNPKSIGQMVYHLVAVGEADTLSGESLPVIIEPVKPLKILLLASSPGFENKFLKNWLTGNGFAVAIRSAISKDKFSSAYVNIEQMPLDHLSSAILDKFDVVISDLSAIHSLNSGEAEALKQQVSQKGLGLIVRADTTFTSALWVQNGFPVKKPLVKDVKASSIIIDSKKITAKLGDSEPLFINAQDGTQTLANDEQNRALAALNRAGGGKVVFTTLNNTYSWMLDGNKNDYATFWSLLISKAARSIPEPQLWQTIRAIPTVNEPTMVQLKASASANQFNIDGVSASSQQNDIIPYQWQASWWPASPGWHNPKISGNLPGAVYVYDENSWRTIKAIEKRAATKKYAENFTSGNNVTKQIHQKISIPVPKGYFYILLLAACIWLWIEGKVGGKVA